MYQSLSRTFLKNLATTFVIAAICGCSKDPGGAPSRTPSGSAGNTSAAGAPAAAGVSSTPGRLATFLQPRSAPPEGDSHRPQDAIVFSEQGRGVAYIAEVNGSQFVMHNGRAGTPWPDISHLKISPDGRRACYSTTAAEKRLQMVCDGAGSPMYVDVYDAVFSPDSRHVAYLAEGLDRLMYIVLDGRAIEAVGNVVSAAFHFTGDSRKLLYQVRPHAGTDAQLVIYDVAGGGKTALKCRDHQVVMNRSGDRVAMVTREGGKEVVADFAVSAPQAQHRSVPYDDVSNLSLQGGTMPSFVGTRGKGRYLVVQGNEEPIPDGAMIYGDPVVAGDGTAGGIVLARDEARSLHYWVQQWPAGEGAPKEYTQVKDLVYGRGKSDIAFVAAEGARYFVVLRGKEGPAFDAATTPIFSPDGKKLVYRAREGGKRFVVVADVATGVHRRLPEYEMVFPTAFTADGRSVAYGVKEGDALVWKVEKL